MTIPVKFLVDKLTDDKTYGLTTSISRILHNINLLPKDWRLNEYKDIVAKSEIGSTFFMAAGRYIIFLRLSKNSDKGSMEFFDTKNDDNLALDLSKYFGKDHWRTEFIRHHFLLKPFYERDYLLAEISTDDYIFN